MCMRTRPRATETRSSSRGIKPVASTDPRLGFMASLPCLRPCAHVRDRSVERVPEGQLLVLLQMRDPAPEFPVLDLRGDCGAEGGHDRGAPFGEVEIGGGDVGRQCDWLLVVTSSFTDPYLRCG